MAAAPRALWADLVEYGDDADVLGPWATYEPGQPASPPPGAATMQKEVEMTRPAYSEHGWSVENLYCLMQVGSASEPEGTIRFRDNSTMLMADCGPQSAEHNEADALLREIHLFACAVMDPGSHVQWGHLAEWQRDLRPRVAGQWLPNPFWHALLFDLDIELHVQVETFTKMLLEETWPLPLLGAWQNSLRSEAHKVWFPRRLWYELIHHTDLTLSPAQVRSRLRHLVVGGGREQTSRFHP